MIATPLHKNIGVKGRFHRSVSVQRDWHGGFDLSEYIATPAACAIAEQVFSELQQPHGARAWSVTGPYGTGKSAFLLFLVDCLCRKKPSHETGRTLRSRFFPRSKPLHPILLQAERSPLAPLLVRALDENIRGIAGHRAKKWRSSVAAASRSDQAIAELLVEGATIASEAGSGGLIIAIDEFGKFLEYASAQPSDGDVFLLQQIAEAATRSSIPIVLMTVLHSGFADYVNQADDVRRAEWQKVQGRYRDIAFQLPADQMLGLVAHALENKLPESIARAYAQNLDEQLGQLSTVPCLSDRHARELLHRCVPLHPLTATLLWPLFRSKAAQNERSLFSFLTSHEPYGLQEFLERNSATSKSVPFLSLDDLYDYICASLGMATFSGMDSRRWALIDHALNRIPASSPALARRIVKAIGLLDMYGGPVGLQASEKVLRTATGASTSFDEVLKGLLSDSIILFRRHRSSFGLWEGSDLDLEALFSQARARISRERLGDRLSRLVSLHPFVARAHYIKTGTLRYFSPCLSDVSGESISRSIEESSLADGMVLFLVGQGKDASRVAADISKAGTNDRRPIIVGVPKLDGDVAAVIDELECWKWVRDHVPEIEADSVAKQEVVSRLESAKSKFERSVGPIFGSSGFSIDPTRSSWFHKGKLVEARNARSFQSILSQVCDGAYCKAPELRNELLNRQSLSSAGAKARRVLIEAMVRSGHLEELGFTGYPPERSMYRAMLGDGGFHKPGESDPPFVSPSKKSWRPAWNEVVKFLSAPDSPRRSVTELIDVLRQPPYGLRDGPIPVLLTAALLSLGPAVAIYEDGLFVPGITVEMLERMLRRPETFEVQSYALSELERQVLREIARMEADAASSKRSKGEAELVTIVRDFVKVAAELPPYTKQTKRGLDDKAKRVRDLLLQARDPKKLLFQDLPASVGLNLASEQGPVEFARVLRETLVDLTRAYPALLDEIGKAMEGVFKPRASQKHALSAVRDQSIRLRRLLTEDNAKALANEAIREIDGDWRERLGRACNRGKPTRFWADEDLSQFHALLHSIGMEFSKAEEIAAVQGDDCGQAVVSIAVIEPGGGLHREVVRLQDAGVRGVSRFDGKVLKILEKAGVTTRADQIASLSRLVWNLSRREQKSSEEIEE